MPIRKLPTLLVNQIAAGEVIERPASIVKELVENSLDAGATRIEVTVEDGGRRLIRISDDGRGIPADELTLAVAPHATSKLERAEQLEAIRTLGFRGEALASIGSVSRLRVTSRPTIDDKPSEEAARIEVNGGEESDIAPAAGAPGTVVEVRDLFFNTPARRKFMRTAQTEFGHINETVQRIAMVQPRVAFKLVHNERTVLDVAATDTPTRRCIELIGKDLSEGLLPFEHTDPPERGGARLWGLAGTPDLARGSTKQQFLAVNHRPVRDRNLTHALKEAYRGLIPPDRQPVAVVFIEIDPAHVDVNVHPAKAEVRFRNPSQVHGLVLSSLRQRLLASDLTPSAALNTEREDASELPGRAPVSAPIDNRQSAIGNVSARDFVDYFRRMDPTQKGFVYEQVKQAVDADKGVFAAREESEASETDNGHDASLRARDILQVHESYVVTQDEDGLLIVDQHALHERVMFEQLWQRVLGEGRPLESQRLLMPAQVAVGRGREALLEQLAPLFERIGIEAAMMGPETLAVHAFPSFLFDRNVEPSEFIEALLDKVDAGEIDASNLGNDDGRSALEASLHTVLDMMACKAAVKAGDHLGEAELAALLERRREIERSSNCPHGRPTTIRLTLRDLEKQFKRT
ncbi:MAG: DNA mismatch repair endonuclease MutL [Phycisphaeraceae bacterium]